MIDYGHANFSDSAGARNVIAAANPLTPGGASPKSVHLPTFGWIAVFLVIAFLVYHFVIRTGKRR